jgi:hypothetical protein
MACVGSLGSGLNAIGALSTDHFRSAASSIRSTGSGAGSRVCSVDAFCFFMFSSCKLEEGGEWVALEHAQSPDVAVNGALGAMTGLALNRPDRHASPGGACDQAGP